MHGRKIKTKRSSPPPRRWWVFKLKSGEIQKRPGTELRETDEFYEVWDERIFQLRVRKADIADRWAQETENHPREKL